MHALRLLCGLRVFLSPSRPAQPHTFTPCLTPPSALLAARHDLSTFTVGYDSEAPVAGYRSGPGMAGQPEEEAGAVGVSPLMLIAADKLLQMLGALSQVRSTARMAGAPRACPTGMPASLVLCMLSLHAYIPCCFSSAQQPPHAPQPRPDQI